MEQKQRETKRCPYCGEEIMATAKKCRYCGSWLTGEVPPSSVPPVDNVQHTNPIESAESKRPNRPNVIASLVILAVAAILAVIIAVTMHTSGGRMNNSGDGDYEDSVMVDSVATLIPSRMMKQIPILRPICVARASLWMEEHLSNWNSLSTKKGLLVVEVSLPVKATNGLMTCRGAFRATTWI